jgi:3-mercaptopyruvate sulfurtransferase SseA
LEFPDQVLSAHGLRAQTPDHLLTELYDQIPDAVAATTRQARQNLRRSLVPPAAFVEALSRQGLQRFAASMRGHLGEL